MTSDCNEFIVKLTQIGLNTSRAKGEAVGVRKTVTLRHEDTIEVLEGQYKYKLFFNPPPPLKQVEKGKFDLNDKEVKLQPSSGVTKMPVTKKQRTVGEG